MGSAEGTMSVFAKRLKNGRSWSGIGLRKMSDMMAALKDNLVIEMIHGDLQSEGNTTENETKEKPPKHFVEKLINQVGEATRNNVAYLYQSIHKPVFSALKG